MQDLSSEDKKIPPKNYQKQPKNYPRIVFGHKNVGFTPIRFQKFTYTCNIENNKRIFTFKKQHI